MLLRPRRRRDLVPSFALIILPSLFVDDSDMTTTTTRTKSKGNSGAWSFRRRLSYDDHTTSSEESSSSDTPEELSTIKIAATEISPPTSIETVSLKSPMSPFQVGTNDEDTEQTESSHSLVSIGTDGVSAEVVALSNIANEREQADDLFCKAQRYVARQKASQTPSPIFQAKRSSYVVEIGQEVSPLEDGQSSNAWTPTFNRRRPQTSPSLVTPPQHLKYHHLRRSAALLDADLSPSYSPGLKQARRRLRLEEGDDCPDDDLSLLTSSSRNTNRQTSPGPKVLSANDTPQTVPFCGLVEVECNYGNSSPSGEEILSSLELERTISKFLESTVQMDTWFGGWQAWSLQSTGGSSRENTPKKTCKSSDEEEIRQNIHRLFQRRTVDLQTRRRKLAALRRDLHPFSQPHSSSTPPRAAIHVQRSQSLSALSQRHSNARRHKHKTSSTKSSPMASQQTLLPSLSYWHCGAPLQCLSQHDESPPVVHVRNSVRPLEVLHDDDEEEEEDNGYDSDPEFIVRPSVSSDHDKENECLNGDHRRVRLFGSNSCSHHSSRSNDEDEEVIVQEENPALVRQVVQELINDRMTLILHEYTVHSDEGQENEPHSKTRPHGVSAWIERGQNLKNSIVPPTFVWRSIHSRDKRDVFSLRSSLSSMSRRRQEINSIALLDIHRVLEVDKIDKTILPFCRASNSFLIKTLDRTVLFEASSPEERNRLVSSLKLAVARLGSLLLLQDDKLLDEFFAGESGSEDRLLDGVTGPGNAPYFLDH